MALIDFTFRLSNARQFYSSMGNPLGWKGLKVSIKLRINTFMTIWGFDAQCFLEEERFYAVKSKAEFLKGSSFGKIQRWIVELTKIDFFVVILFCFVCLFAFQKPQTGS